MDLQDLRNEIDSIDNQLVHLFTARMGIAARIADYKKINGLPILMPEREHQKLEAVCKFADDEMADYVRMLYSTIFELSRDYQTKKIRL